MAEKREFTFLSADGKTAVRAIEWQPTGEPAAIFQLTHGMIEHIDRYDGLGKYLSGNGFYVVGHDHLGHGGTAKTSEDYGYFADKKGDEMLLADMHELRRIAKEKYPALPYFMLGHSMGSYFLRRYIAAEGEGLSGALIMGTGANPGAVAIGGIGVCSIIALFKGWRYRSPFMEKLFFTGTFDKYDNDGGRPELNWRSKDPAVGQSCLADHRCNFRFTLKAYRDFLKTILFVSRRKSAEAAPKDLPLFILSGAEDPIGGMGEGVRKVYDMYSLAGVKDVTLKLYEDCRHEILLETEKELIFEDILGWCTNKMQPAE
ncbi:MAG: alpha/beta hydrolase [Clostridia bacterium]|nr:alpha/beta hydrolase [Clostridia bacterium]